MLTFKVSLGGRYRNANGGDVTPAKQAFVGTEQINNKRTCCVRLNSSTILGPSRYILLLNVSKYPQPILLRK